MQKSPPMHYTGSMPPVNTALIAQTLNVCLCAGIVFYLWLKSRKYYSGVGWWTLQAAGQAASYAFLLTRYTGSEQLAVILGSGIFIVTLPALSHGMDIYARHASDTQPPIKLVFVDPIIALALILTVIYFVLSNADSNIRGIPLDLAFFWFYGRAALTLALSVKKGRRENLIAAVLYGFISLGAVLGDLLRQLTVPRNETGLLYETAIYLSLMVSTTAITFAQSLMLTGRVAANLANERTKYRTVFNTAPYSIILTRLADGKILDTNERLCGYSGYKVEEMLGRTSVELGLWADTNGREALYSAIRTKGHFEGENFTFRRRDGLTLPCYVSARKLEYDGEDAVLSILKDMSEYNRLNRKIEEMATLDMLTGLPNRRYFYDLASGNLARAARTSDRLAVVTVALDDFKRINDTYGHAQGDQILVEASLRIKRELREGDILARFAGDEFVILLSDILRDEDIIMVMERIMKGFERPFEVAGVETRLSCSQGAASYPDQAEDLDRLIALSDATVHQVKIGGKRGFRLAPRKLV